MRLTIVRLVAVILLIGQASAGAARSMTSAAPTSSAARFGDGGTSAFYLRSAPRTAQPGKMLAVEPLDQAHLPTSAASGSRLLYTSTSGVGPAGIVAVSGQLLLPRGPAPAGGWPIVAWEHGTTGIADICAPSWRGYSARDRAYLNRWLEEGYAVVATDYQGLGTPGPHPYLLYRAEGYSALDAVRASLSEYGTMLRNQVVIVGQSQGSGAALGSAWLAPHYSPQVNIVGVVATGLVVTFKRQAHPRRRPIPVRYDDPSSMDSAYAILRVEGTDQSLHAGKDVRTVETAKGAQLSTVARTACLTELFKAAEGQKVKSSEMFAARLSQFEIGEKEASAIPDAAIKVPVFAGTGLADFEASLPAQYNAVAAMCDAGASVEWHTYPGLTHNGTVNASLADSVPFVKRLLSGQHGNSTCAQIAVPGPLQTPASGVPFNN